jgi:hypothetical protein
LKPLLSFKCNLQRYTAGAEMTLAPISARPVCALPADRVVQFSGADDAVRKALELFCARLDYRVNPPVEVGLCTLESS